MFGIGDFARHGRVSVRMLRHYHAMGLLVPARVDAATGYRWYDASQFSRLNRIVAMKGLGFTLQEVRAVLEEQFGPDELRELLTVRREELRMQIAAETAKLGQVELRLRMIEREGEMPSEDVQVKRIPPMRVAEFSGIAASFEPASIAPVITPLFAQLRVHLRRLRVPVVGHEVAWYDPGEADRVVVHAGIPVDEAPGSLGHAVLVDLPEIEQAATIIHHGPMDHVMATLQVLAVWIQASGHRSTGYNRELYLAYADGKDPSSWVTELQEPIAVSQQVLAV